MLEGDAGRGIGRCEGIARAEAGRVERTQQREEMKTSFMMRDYQYGQEPDRVGETHTHRSVGLEITPTRVACGWMSEATHDEDASSEQADMAVRDIGDDSSHRKASTFILHLQHANGQKTCTTHVARRVLASRPFLRVRRSRTLHKPIGTRVFMFAIVAAL